MMFGNRLIYELCMIRIVRRGCIYCMAYSVCMPGVLALFECIWYNMMSPLYVHHTHFLEWSILVTSCVFV